jgi:hypothetical protein
MEPNLVGTLIYLARSTLSAWLFTIAGVILVVSHPRWRGSWVLLVGAILLSALAGIRLIGLVPDNADVSVLLAFEAGDTLGFVLSGLGIVMVSIRDRKETH